jgi:ribosomal protein S26
MGKKLSSKIDKDIKQDRHAGNLPFSFGKPSKSRGHSCMVKCDNCGAVNKIDKGHYVRCSECLQFGTLYDVV